MTRPAICKSQSKCYLVTIILAMSAPVLTAQEPLPQPEDPKSETTNVSQPSGEKDHFYPRRFLRDEYRIWTSPFRPSTYRSDTMRKYGAPFLLVASGLLASDRKTAHLFPNTFDQLRWSGRVSQMGASYTVAAFAGATYIFGKAIGNKHASRTGLLGLEAYAHTQLVVLGIKTITGRERPIENDQNGSFWRGGNSFPSGHAATSFSLATVFAYEYGHKHITVPIAAYSIATLITVSRTSARRHWPSDVVVGASLGFLIGRFVHKNHRDQAVDGSPGGQTSRLVPEVGFTSGGAKLNWSF